MKDGVGRAMPKSQSGVGGEDRQSEELPEPMLSVKGRPPVQEHRSVDMCMHTLHSQSGRVGSVVAWVGVAHRLGVTGREAA